MAPFFVTAMDSLPIHSFFFLVCWSFCLLPLCASSNSRLLPNKPLSAGSILISDDGTFALGFFSPSNSTKKYYYVGIWYNNVPKDNVVWVANRATPIADPSSATLVLTNRSDLVVTDANGQLLWMANISTASNSSSEVTSGEATLDNSGNFIVRSSQGIILWQSSDYPTDTLFPGMKLRITHKTHALQRLISWKNPQDPAPGNFSYGADPNDFLQRFAWNGSRPYRRSPVWSNYLTGGQYVSSPSTIYLALDLIGDELYMSIVIQRGPLVMQLKVDYSGKVKAQTWNSRMSEWNVLNAQPVHECNTYGYCGPFGYCDNEEPIVTCKCLYSFEPKNNKDWRDGRFSEGCHRKETLRCDQQDDFLTLTAMKIPDMFLRVKNRNFNECMAECTRNCSCTAYAHSNMSTREINEDATRCLLWFGDLMDAEKVPEQSGENLYIRINRLGGNMRKGNIVKIVPSVVATLLIIICMWLVWISNCRGERRNRKIWKKLMLGVFSTSDQLGDWKLKYPFINFREITAATNNFSDSNMLGSGGFGNVYKGTLEDGKQIAVKRLSKGSGQGGAEFRNEVVLIAKLQHRNLVRLIGCSIHGDEKLLIYEYLPNKSLDAFIFNPTRKSVLDWPTRFKIIKGIARGLLYLHQDSRLTIIHRDLKSSNILLDAEMNPKISDFGMARIFDGNKQQANTNRVVGTYGYMSPEYALEGAFSVKSDVYSFGVLLLEIVSGSRISSTHLLADFPNLIAFAWSLWNDGNPKDLVHSSIAESCLLDEALRCIHAGLLCVQDNPNARPLMSSVVSSLENGAIALPPPKQPIYFAQRNNITDGGGENIESSENKMSLTALEGR